MYRELILRSREFELFFVDFWFVFFHIDKYRSIWDMTENEEDFLPMFSFQIFFLCVWKSYSLKVEEEKCYIFEIKLSKNRLLAINHSICIIETSNWLFVLTFSRVCTLIFLLPICFVKILTDWLHKGNERHLTNKK